MVWFDKEYLWFGLIKNTCGLVIISLLLSHLPVHSVTILTDVLPECEYSPSYVSEHEVSRYTGFKEILQSVVYPDDHTWHKNGRHDSEGNPLIEEEVGS